MNTFGGNTGPENSNNFNANLSHYIYLPSAPVYCFTNVSINTDPNVIREAIQKVKIKLENFTPEKDDESTVKKYESDTTPEKKYTPYEVNSESNLLHVSQEEYLITCDMCDFQSKDHREMDVHRLSHGLKRSDSTSTCISNYNATSPDITSTSTNTKTVKLFHCDLCSYTSKTSTQLTSHKKTHSDEKAYGCSHCSFRSKYLSGLRYHELSHTKCKEFQCNECKFTCLTAAQLRSHQRKHSVVASYICHLCTYSCKYPAGLRYHMLSHTKGKDISCNLCSYACRTVNELKIHSKKHSPQMWTCEFCGFSCKSKKTLTQHADAGCRTKS